MIARQYGRSDVIKYRSGYRSKTVQICLFAASYVIHFSFGQKEFFFGIFGWLFYSHGHSERASSRAKRYILHKLAFENSTWAAKEGWSIISYTFALPLLRNWSVFYMPIWRTRSASGQRSDKIDKHPIHGYVGPWLPWDRTKSRQSFEKLFKPIFIYS